MLLPAALRYLKVIKASGISGTIGGKVLELTEKFEGAIAQLAEVNAHHPEGTEVEAEYMRDTVLVAMAQVREYADALERLVADDLWPLPKYAEILFVR